MKSAILPLLLLLFLTGCRPSGIQIASRNFEDLIEVRQNLEFHFNTPIVSDSMTGKWSSVQYLRLDPPVEGRFKWLAPDELIFSPSVRFHPATEYSLTLTDEIPRAGKLTLGVDPEPIRFATPMPSVVSYEAYWTRAAAATEPELRLVIRFNYAVDPAHIHSHLRIQLQQESVSFLMAPQAEPDLIQLTVRHPALNPDNRVENLSLVIPPGLTSTEGSGKSTEAQEMPIEVPEATSLAVLSVTGEPTPDGGLVRIHCNQGIDLGYNPAKWFRIQPPVPVRVEALDYGCILTGPFQPYVEYEITVLKGLPGMLSGGLAEDQTAAVSFSESGPVIEFIAGAGMYMSPKSAGNLGIRISGLEQVELSVARIYENNILSFFREESYADYQYDFETGEPGPVSRDFSYSQTQNHGDIAFTRTIPVNSMPVLDDHRLLNPGLERLSGGKGVYLVKVSSPQDRWVRDARLVSFSDIGLMAKTSGDEVWVFAHAISSTRPIPGVAVTLISSNNQVMQKGLTDGRGVAVFSRLSTTAPGFVPRLLTASLNQDFTFLDLSETRVSTDRWEDLNGLKTTTAGLLGFVYGDRNLYRPGDTLHLVTLVRDNNLIPVSGQPVKLRILRPDGKEGGWHTLAPGTQGQGFLNLPIPAGGMTGTWQAELFTGDDQLLYTYRYSVEEFTPDRIAVQVNPGSTTLASGEVLRTQAYAALLYGPPAAGRTWEADIQFRRKNLRFSNWPGYRFNPDFSGSGSDLIASERRGGQTDSEGKFSFECPLSGISPDAGLVTAQAFISVMDEGGKAVHRLAEYEVRTQNTFPGVRCVDHWVNASAPVSLSLVNVSPNGTPVPGQVRVQLIRYLWQNVVEKDYRGYFNFVPRRQEVLVSDQMVSTGQAAVDFSLRLPASGEYEVRVSRPASAAFIRLPLYAWAWGSTRSNSFQVNREGQILITANRTQAEPGDKVRLLFRTPFAGKLLVTLERDRVMEYQVVETQNRAAILDITVRPEHVPNVFVSATLIKPLDDGSMPLTVAYGYLNLKVEKQSARMKLEVVAPDQIRSGKPHRFVVKGPPNTDLTLSVVDEGVLLMKNYHTPDPYQHFYGPRALETYTHSLYPLLFPDLKMRRLAYGGDGYALGRRVNPFLQSSKQVIAAWSGPIRTNSAGEASLVVNIPVYAGAVRVMAGAWNQSAFGMAEKVVRIADPLVVHVNTPPALAPGDSLLMPVIVSKTTAGQAQATLALSVGKGLKIKGSATQTITLTPNRETVTWFTLFADAPVEKTSLITLVSCGGEKIREESSLTIQPPSAYTSVGEEGSLVAGQTVRLQPGGNWYPGTLKQTLMAGASPLAGISWHLKELIQYPHGCLEQTVSAAFPQLYLPALAEAAGLGMKAGAAPAFVQQAITKLERMQLYHGGFAYWEGGTEVSEWGSVYALHFLTEADKAGYSVRKEMMESALKWTSGLVRNRKNGGEEAALQENNQVVRVPSLTALYALMVLAEAGKPERAAMNYYKGRLSELSDLKRCLLASAYHYCGDLATARSLSPPVFQDAPGQRESGGEFNSWVRNQALALNALLDLSPGKPATQALADKLMKQMAQSPELNTQERAMALLALGKYASRQKPGPVVAEITLGETTQTYSSETQPWLRLPVQGIVSIKVLKGTLHYNLIREGYATGVRTTETVSGLKVKKAWLNRSGAPVDLARLRRNELVVVRISVQAEAGRTLDNVVITDLIPPGLEIENHRISSLPDFNLSPAASQPQHLDIRRDRLLFFTSVNGTEKHFYYLARAMWAGTFQVPPVRAECMYDAGLKSVNGIGRLVIVE